MIFLKKVAATPLTAIARVIDSVQEATNDRTNAPSIHAVREAIKDNWLNIYPIGSIYMSVNDADPSLVFGGTWEQIKDRFLLACGDSYENGETGGAANHTPSGTVGGHTLTAAEIPSHTHGYAWAQYMNVQSGTSGIAVDFSGTQSTQETEATGGGGSHNHSFTGISDNYMPPYLAVNVWVRTA